ncbi:hypothetical protein SAMN05421666_3374 [Roseovarius nanhaiticus]|uniref:Uncharacterized protein n=1 Tax=Roseovarius nanhaiticus TaxID=573024 RepID=A0A1N7HM46_9RHOB|nr:hypothetical protein SAMN05216208_3350 [Roseovarius nanhaiticus]SIS25768.1 hypothetical protein SAMN05421666_3374 [Roseovarius nanhaiticus]
MRLRLVGPDAANTATCHCQATLPGADLVAVASSCEGARLLIAAQTYRMMASIIRRGGRVGAGPDFAAQQRDVATTIRNDFLSRGLR